MGCSLNSPDNRQPDDSVIEILSMMESIHEAAPDHMELEGLETNLCRLEVFAANIENCDRESAVSNTNQAQKLGATLLAVKT